MNVEQMLSDQPLFFNAHPGIRDALVQMEFEGVPFTVPEDQTLNPGDTYLAERNQGVKLLTCREHIKENNFVGGYVLPVETAYAYDYGECIKIELLID